MVVMMAWVSVAGARGGMGVLHCAEEVHCSRGPLSEDQFYSIVQCEQEPTVGAILTAETMLGGVGWKEGFRNKSPVWPIVLVLNSEL